jgi:hypothetical protein
MKWVHKLDECELVEQLKKRLTEDPDMMIRGSSAYATTYSKMPQTVLVGQAVKFDVNQILYNIDHTVGDDMLFIREAGLYIFNFIIESAQACQFTAFVNGVATDTTTVGKNSGAGILVMGNILFLKNGDNLSFRNWASSIGSITSNNSPGGTVSGTNASVMLYRIAPTLARIECNDKNKNNEEETKQIYCNKKIKKLFKCVLDKMLCDKGVMLEGVDARGAFYKTKPDIVPLEAPITFEFNNNVECLAHIAGNPNIVIQKSGVYRVEFSVSILKSGQFGLFVNGVAVDGTITGIFQGASEVVQKYILNLNKNDQITLVNHSSIVGDVQLATNSGGITSPITGLNTSLVLTRIAPLACDIEKCNERDDKDCFYSRKNCKWNLLYNLYKHYLLIHRKLMPAGIDTLISAVHKNQQNIKLNAPFLMDTNLVNLNIRHKTGTGDFIIRKNGYYMYSFELNTQEPTQISVFINGCVVVATSIGTDSGASQTVANNILKLCKGDCVQIRNAYSSGSSDNSVNLDVNPGGNEVANNVSVAFTKIAPLCNRK